VVLLITRGNSEACDEVAMRKVMIFALALLCAPAGLFGQALHPDSLFPRLIGHWVLRGTIARQQTVHDVTFEWLLGREYVQMHEVPSCSTTPRPTASTRPSCMIARRTRGSGTWTTTVPEYADRLHGSP